MTHLLAVEREGKTYAITPEILLKELVYSCYQYNRQRAPEILPEEWKAIFPTALAMEQRLQSENPLP